MKKVASSVHPKSNLAVTYVPIDDLKAATYNPRTWDEVAEEKLKESIRRFGIVDPLVVNGAKNRKNIVIGGHFRLAVAKSLGYTQMPVVYLDIKDIEREKELNLRLNRNSGSFNLDLLKEFDVGMLLDIGFDDSDLSSIWDNSLSIEDDNFDIETSAIEAKKTTVKTGDLFALGEHRLLCADSLVLENVQRVVGKCRMAMFYTDFPYNIKLDYSKGISTKGKYQGEVNDARSWDEYRTFLKTCLSNGLSVMQKDAHIFSWCDQNYVGMVQELYRELGIANKRTCLWIKNSFNMTPQVAFNKAHEPCVFGTIGKPYLNESVTNLTEILNRDIQPGNRTIDDIGDYLDIWLAKRVNGQDYVHPTEKPPNLHEKPLRRCTKVGDCVIDLCAGSGSILTACHQMKRRAFMIEQSPIFTQVIIDRYETLTGEKAKRIN